MLMIDITINRDANVTSLGAVRIEPKEIVDADTVSTYQVGYIFDGKVQIELGEIQHKYSDGALFLSNLVLNLASKHAITPQVAFNRYGLLRLEKS